MSVYNTVTATLTCPHCGNAREVWVDFEFGLRDQLDYKIGNAIRWEGRGVKTPSRRPAGGNFEGEGYTECPCCGRAFWALITVRADIITDVTVDTDREDYS